MKASARYLLLPFILLLAANNALGQQESTPCDLNVNLLPEVRGFKLGMALKNIQKRHPNFKVPAADEHGYSELEYFVHYLMSYGEESLINESDRKGLKAIAVAFLDDRLYFLRVTYDDSVEWENVSDFLATITKSLNLPDPSKWAIGQQSERLIHCKGVSLKVRMENRGASISFGRHGLKDILTQREKNIKERKRHEFTP